jgi:hypothetical protein
MQEIPLCRFYYSKIKLNNTMEELDIHIHDVLIVEAVPCGLAVAAVP